MKRAPHRGTQNIIHAIDGGCVQLPFHDVAVEQAFISIVGSIVGQYIARHPSPLQRTGLLVQSVEDAVIGAEQHDILENHRLGIVGLTQSARPGSGKDFPRSLSDAILHVGKQASVKTQVRQVRDGERTNSDRRAVHIHIDLAAPIGFGHQTIGVPCSGAAGGPIILQSIGAKRSVVFAAACAVVILLIRNVG